MAHCIRYSMVLAAAVWAIHAASGPHTVRSVSLALPPLAGEPVGRWDGNALISVQDYSSTAPILHISNGAGREIERIVFQVPGADLVKMLNNRFAHSADGYLALGGTAYGNSRAAGFLAIIPPDRKLQKLIKTEPYVPYAIAFASDGAIWTAGIENDENGLEKGLADYPIIRRFDRQGYVVTTALSRMTFPTRYTPVDGSMLVSSSDRVGWLVPAAQRYIEFSLNGKDIGDYIIGIPRIGLEGAALCEDNSLWISVRDGDHAIVESFNRKDSSLAARFSEKPFMHIYGCAANTLVATSNWSKVDWITP